MLAFWRWLRSMFTGQRCYHDNARIIAPPFESRDQWWCPDCHEYWLGKGN